MEIKEIKKSYQRKQKLYETKDLNLSNKTKEIRKKIEILEMEINQLKEKRSNLKYPHFNDNYIKPLAEELLKHNPLKGKYIFSILGPFGLSCESSIHFLKKGVPEKELYQGSKSNVISLNFRPIHDNGEKDLVLVNNLKNTEKFKKGTIGEMNGFNFSEVKMPKNIKELIKFMKKQNANKGVESK